MNILFLSLNVNVKRRTGDAVHVRELVRNLAKLGNTVSLMAEYNQEPDNELQTLYKDPLISIYFNENIINVRSRLNDFLSLWACLKIAYKRSPDIIYERGSTFKIGAILSKILRIPFVVEINGIVEDEAKLLGTHINHQYTKKLRRNIRKLFFNSANKIVVVTSGIKEDLQNKYHISPDKIVVIPNGANTDVFRPMDQIKAKEELGLNQNVKYVCFVGNLAPWQGVEYLIKAAPAVLAKVPESRFLIVGDGVVREELEIMVAKMDLQDNFLFTGSVPFEVVPKYINASDVCISVKKPVLPGSPLKVFEYMACEKPVIATRKSAYGFEILEEVGAGLLVNPENKEEVSNAIVDILHDSVKGHEMGIKGRDTVVKQYSWKNTATKVVDVCNSSIK